jgi:hypothetical protein
MKMKKATLVAFFVSLLYRFRGALENPAPDWELEWHLQD